MAKKPTKKMTMAEYERTPLDHRNDKRGARKAGTSVAAYEKSRKDAAEDRDELRKINSGMSTGTVGKKGKKGRGR